MLNPYLLYIKAGLALVVLLVLGFMGYKVHSWRQDSLALSGVRQEMSDLKAAQEASHKASQDLSDELQKLRTARKPAPDVRLHRCPDKVPGSGARNNGGAAPSGGVSPQDGQDSRNVGPDLYGIADDADELSARLRACQALLK